MAPFEVDARSSPLSPFSLPSLDRVTNPSNGARIRIVVAHSFNSHAGDRRPSMVQRPKRRQRLALKEAESHVDQSPSDNATTLLPFIYQSKSI